ncbi:DMT family transporter [Mangrovicoccus algicola]|uniref:DMT family transporter n=1 Tax=Mangrovicoccus algicola TaxID=2771008 RepID=A0A8J6Z9U0_9RHOB|nr:DMT family transporter [Mangrovicoccus algicola]MBE3638990.1 DMT family transporter [Mangrovicoccus algicola]
MGWMALSGLAFVCFIAAMKSVGSALPVAEGAFLRFAFGLVFLLPLAGQIRAHWPRGRDLRLFLLRGAVHSVAICAWFFAIARIPIAEVTAINYLSPVCVTVGAALFLGERLAARRIAAVIVALIGALILLRPGFRTLEPGHLAMILAAVSLGTSYVIGKTLAARFPAGLVVAWMSLAVTPILAPLALADWVTPSWPVLGLLALAAGFANLGHYLMTLAFRAAPVAVTQPVTFLQLVWSVILGLVVFGEPVDPFVLIGGGVIVGAVSFIAWREHMLGRRAARTT